MKRIGLESVLVRFQVRKIDLPMQEQEGMTILRSKSKKVELLDECCFPVQRYPGQ
jgi:hypothetical protein